MSDPDLGLLDLAAVKRLTSLSRSSIDKLMEADRFPRSVRIPGIRRKAWSRAAVVGWLNARVADRRDPHIEK